MPPKRNLSARDVRYQIAERSLGSLRSLGMPMLVASSFSKSFRFSSRERTTFARRQYAGTLPSANLLAVRATFVQVAFLELFCEIADLQRVGSHVGVKIIGTSN